MMDKVMASAGEAVADIESGASIAVGGFGLVGVPEVLIAALLEQGASDLETISNNCGTDGFGLSDTRPAARRHFGVDAENVVVAVLAALARRGEVEHATVRDAAARYRIDDPQAAAPQTSDAGVA